MPNAAVDLPLPGPVCTASSGALRRARVVSPSSGTVGGWPCGIACPPPTQRWVGCGLDHVGQRVGPQLRQPHRGRAELAGQLLGQTQSHIGRLAVHHDGRRTLGDQPGRRGPGPAQRVGPTRGPAVGEHHHQAAARAVPRLLPHHHVARGQQTLRQRGFAAGVEARQPAAGDVHRRRRRQQHLRLLAAEGDHGDLVAALIRVAQQRQRGPADRRHPVARRHRPRRVDDEDHQVAFAAFANRAADVVGRRSRPRPGAAGDPPRRAASPNRCTP